MVVKNFVVSVAPKENRILSPYSRKFEGGVIRCLGTNLVKQLQH
jgi:hypothetical protein